MNFIGASPSPFGAGHTILAYTPLGMSSTPGGISIPCLTIPVGVCLTSAIEHTPGGIKVVEALVTAGPAGRTPITMTAPATIDSQDLQRAPRVRLRRHGFSTSEPQASSRPPTSPAPTTFRWTCCASTATRSSGTSTKRSCWCVAPVSGPRRPRRPCARPGLDNVHILDGGITAWEANGFRGQPRRAALGPRAPGAPRRRLDRADEHPAAASPRPSSSGSPPRSAAG